MGKWETCFWFSTFPSAVVVGAVGMWKSRLPLVRFPRGSWKEGKACPWLSTLSTARHLHNSVLALSAAGLPAEHEIRHEGIECGGFHAGARSPAVLSSDAARLRASLPPPRVWSARSTMPDGAGHNSSLLSRISSLNCQPSKLINMRPNSCQVISRPSMQRSGTEPPWESSHSMLPRTTR